MNKILFCLLLLVAACGQKYETLVQKIELLKESRDLAPTDREQLFLHVELVRELASYEIHNKWKIPANIDCASFVLGQAQLSQLACKSGLFNTCPREMDEYMRLSEQLVQTCQTHQEKL